MVTMNSRVQTILVLSIARY